MQELFIEKYLFRLFQNNNVLHSGLGEQKLAMNWNFLEHNMRTLFQSLI